MSYKTVIIGNYAVGKTSLVRRLIYGAFSHNVESTIGCAFNKYSVPIRDEAVTFDLWDTAGHERFRSVLPFYVRGADIILFVFDASRLDTLAAIDETWIPYITVTCDAPKTLFVLVENKFDLKCGQCDRSQSDQVQCYRSQCDRSQCYRSQCYRSQCDQVRCIDSAAPVATTTVSSVAPRTVTFALPPPSPIDNSTSSTPNNANDTPDVMCQIQPTPQEIAARHNMIHFRTSPMTGFGVKELFEHLATILPPKQTVDQKTIDLKRGCCS